MVFLVLMFLVAACLFMFKQCVCLKKCIQPTTLRQKGRGGLEGLQFLLKATLNSKPTHPHPFSRQCRRHSHAGSFGTVLVSDKLLGAGTSSFDCYSDESHDSTIKKARSSWIEPLLSLSLVGLWRIYMHEPNLGTTHTVNTFELPLTFLYKVPLFWKCLLFSGFHT